MTDSLESKIDQALAQAGRELLLLEQLDRALPASMLAQANHVRRRPAACYTSSCAKTNRNNTSDLISLTFMCNGLPYLI